jgi:Ulp1 family protease
VKLSYSMILSSLTRTCLILWAKRLGRPLMNLNHSVNQTQNLNNLDYIQQFMDGRVKIDFGPQPDISQNIASNRLQIEEMTPSSSSSKLTKRKIPKKKVQTRNSFSTASEALKKRDREIDNELKKLREENLQKMEQLKLLNQELEKSLKLKGVQTSSQISQACYTAHSQNESNEEEEEETDVESAEGTARPTASDFQVVPPVDPN